MKKLWAVVLLLALSTVSFSPKVSADVNDFTVTNFTASEVLTNEDPQGMLRVTETINVVYTDNNHGLIRVIPNKYKGNSLKFHLNSVTSPTGAPTNVQQSSSNGNVELRIGDPNRTVTGAQAYSIDYTLRNVITFYEDHDELYWDVNGDQWGQPFKTVRVSLRVPEGTFSDSVQSRCFTGSFGSTVQNCTVSVIDDTLTAETTNLYAGQTLTYVAAFDKGYFSPVTLWQRIMDYRNIIIAILLPPLLVFVVCWRWWLHGGRDDPGKGTIAPEYAPPKDILPIEAGAISDFSVDNRDITATIIDLARRGYLVITENRKDRFLVSDKLTYTLMLKKSDFSTLKPFEQVVMNSLFKDKSVGKAIDLNALKNKLYKTATDLRKDVAKSLTTRGYFKKDPTKYGLSFGILAVFIWIAGIFLGFGALGAAIIGGIFIATFILIAFYRAMPARTAKGVAAREQLLGLKMYMETAEKDRMQMLEGPNAKYAKSAGSPVRTVELFEKLLPFAIVMGVEEQWAGKFKNMYTSPPEWYNGNYARFNSAYLAHSIGSGFAPTVNSGFSAPSSSGSSGSGGGGFSGGGGGGGGGGGW